MSKNAVQELFNIETKQDLVENVDSNENLKANKQIEEKQKIEKEEAPSEKKTQDDKELKDDVSDKTEQKHLADLEKLKKEASDNKRWGQERNQSYILAKKRIEKIAADWSKDGVLDEEGTNALRSIFSVDDAANADESVAENNNIYQTISEKLKKELPLYKKYVKDSNVDENLNGFFEGFGLLPEKTQKDLVDYLQDAEGSDAIERVLTIGADFNDTIGSGINKHGDLFKYVKSLNLENKKLQEEVAKHKKELDIKYGSVDTRGIITRSTYTKKEEPQNEENKVLQELFG